MKTLLIISMAAILFSFSSFSNKSGENNKAECTAKNFNAQIKTNMGKIIELTNVCRKTVLTAVYSTIRTDVATKNEVIAYDFSLDIGSITIRIPYEIVDSLQIKKTKTKYNHYYHTKVFLGNNTTLEGRAWVKFNGMSELGETKILYKDIKSVVFKQEAKTEFKVAPFGAHNVTLNTIDNRKIEVSNANFVKVKANENGVWLANEPSDILNFKETGGSDYEVNWVKI